MLDEAETRGYNVGSWTTGLGPNWVDWPATWHLLGVNISFADAHVEFYRHQDPGTAKITWFHTPAPGSPDLKYFQRIFRPDLN